VKKYVILGLLLTISNQEVIAQTTRLIVPTDSGIQVPFGAVGDVLVAGPGTSQIQDSSTVTPAVIPTYLNLSKPVVMTTGGSTSSNSMLSWFGSVSGTCDTASCGAIQIQANSFQVNGIKTPSLLQVIASSGGAAMIGGIVLTSSNLRINSTTGNVGAGGAYQASGSFAAASVNDNGTSGTPLGNLHGSSTTCSLLNGATFWNSVNCLENDVDLETGSSVRSLIAHSVVLTSTTAVAATTENIAYDVNAGLGATGIFDCGYCFGSYQSHVESTFAAGASLMAVRTNQNIGSGITVTNGIHLNANATFTGNAFDSPGFSVNGNGNLTALTVAVTGATCSGTGWAQTTSNGLGLCSNGTEIGRITSGNQFFLGATAAINAGDQLSMNSTTAGDRNFTMRNVSSGGAARYIMYLGNNTSPTQVSMILNSSSNASGNGFNSFTINSAGNMFLQGGGTNAIGVSSSAVVSLPSTATGTPVASLCLDASNNIVKKTTAGSCI
jgi:hypothetical protein